MGRLGRLPIQLPDGVNVKVDQKDVVVNGPKGELKLTIPEFISVEPKDGEMIVGVKNESRRAREMQGSVRSHIFNMTKGVSEGWKKQLEITGPGFRAGVQGTDLVITAGFSHPVVINAPEGVTFQVEKSNIIINGADKEVVGQTAAIVRGVRPPNPYTGSGIRYSDEIVRRKPGKQAAKAGE